MDKAGRKLFIEDRHINKIQLLCLLAMAILELLIVTLSDVLLLTVGKILPLCFLGSCGLFLLCELFRMYQNKKFRFPILPCIMVAWFLVNSTVRNLLQMDTYSSTCFIAVYLLAFPFAAVTQDSSKQTGLKLSALVFIAAGLILAFDCILLMAGRVPEFIRGELFWDGTRLNVITHANISARVFMVSMAFCLYFFATAKKKWLKILLAAGSLLMFMVMALTNSRTAIALAALLFAGSVFFSIYKHNWKQFLAATIAALAVLALLIWGANSLYDWNSQRLSRSAQIQTEESSDVKLFLQEESLSSFADDNAHSSSLSAASEENAASQMLPSGSPQGSVFDDLFTLNSRTLIWGNVLQGFLNEPSALLWGAAHSQDFVGNGINHTHNAFLEILVKLGLPAFIISLIFSLQALWSAAYILLSRKTDLLKKIVAMLVLCLFASAMMEPFLFMTSTFHNFSDFIFFLCLGYLIMWRKELRKAQKGTSVA